MIPLPQISDGATQESLKQILQEETVVQALKDFISARSTYVNAVAQAAQSKGISIKAAPATVSNDGFISQLVGKAQELNPELNEQAVQAWFAQNGGAWLSVQLA